MTTSFIAHVKKIDDSWASPHLLDEHLEGTAKLAELFSAKFHSGKWGRAGGLAHDAGKARLEWQKYLRLKSGFDEEAHLEGKPGKIPHAIHGAMLAEQLFGKAPGRLLAYCIAGHHAGLPDWSSAEGAGRASLQFQQSKHVDVDQVASFVLEKLRGANPGNPPWRFSPGLDLSLWIRMLYSSVVDADFLDTELYMNAHQAGLRANYCAMPQLLERCHRAAREIDAAAADTKVNTIRRDVRRKCVQMAAEPQGIFSLSVPTGGGKTLSSLAFGLEHAVNHNLDRIIYVIPYTSIIEQNADVFRKAIGADQVLEHHSSFDEDASTPRSRLAAENWDAPVVVTTSVQFFESLFAAKSSRCRKLHNIARSVVILDEAQLVPAEYLCPILETLQLLVEHYHVSVVISTATQPAFGERIVEGKLFKGLKKVTEIMGEGVRKLYDDLRRVSIELPQDLNAPSTWEQIAAELTQYAQVLCIVSDRKSCRELYSLMPKGTLHLSALMCGEHRSEVIGVIEQKLENGEPVRVISTQLVEAGVDLDFPVVYRALAGLDSIAQAAGRCNREGKLELGKVVVFVPPRMAPAGILRKAAETARNFFSLSYEHPLDYSLFERYFSELYWKVNSLDSHGIVDLLSPDHEECGMYFRTAAEKFRLIDDSLQKAILVRYGAGVKLIDRLKLKGPDRELMRQLQRFTVNVYNQDFDQLLLQGTIEEVQPTIFALAANFSYSNDYGLVLGADVFCPEQFNR